MWRRNKKFYLNKLPFMIRRSIAIWFLWKKKSSAVSIHVYCKGIMNYVAVQVSNTKLHYSSSNFHKTKKRKTVSTVIFPFIFSSSISLLLCIIHSFPNAINFKFMKSFHSTYLQTNFIGMTRDDRHFPADTWSTLQLYKLLEKFHKMKKFWTF